MSNEARSFVNFNVRPEEDKLHFRIRHHCEEENADVEFEKVEEVEGYPVMKCPSCGDEVVLGVFNQKEPENGEQRPDN